MNLMNKNRTVVEVCLVIMLNNYYGWILLKSKMSFLVVQKQTLITSYYPSVFSASVLCICIFVHLTSYIIFAKSNVFYVSVIS